jgi:hypothetical protein
VDECIRLGPWESAPGRDFTNPVQASQDLKLVAVMLAALRRALAAGAVRAEGSPPLVLASPGLPGRAHRVIVCDARRLGDGRDLAWVGFFAAKRRDLDSTPLTTMDDELIGEFPAHPGVLSYSSLELDDGDWGNLILLEGDAARQRWREGERHAYAARELAPRHYTDVRLHQGVLPGGVGAGHEPILRRTRYYDYRADVTWRAQRELSS